MQPQLLADLVRLALREDIGPGDITTDLTVPTDTRCRAELLAKQPGVLSGLAVFRAVFDEMQADIADWTSLADGDAFTAGQTIAAFTGGARAVLTGERTALNFVQRLSGIATLSRAFADAVQGLNVRVLDTRKTTPGLRTLEKEAVAHGGARNHRHGLYDGVLIKDNHIAAAGGISKAIRSARAGAHHLVKIEVEVTTLAQLEEALAERPEVILLDNMDLETMRAAVQRGKGLGVLFEASGNVRLETIRAIAETGVDFISAGALTHSAPAIDLSLEIALV